MTINEGRLTNPEPWRTLPADVMASLRQWAEGQAFDLTHRSWLTAGKSGSFVAVVWLRPQSGMLRGAVLKLIPPDLAAKESRGVGLARQHVPPSFYSDHLIDTVSVNPLPGSGWWVHLQELATADLAKMVPLADLIDDPNFGDYCATILASISDGLNPGHNDLHPDTVEASQFLIQDVGRDGLEAVRQVIDSLDLSSTATEIAIPGRPDLVSNPLALLGENADVRPVDLFRGNGHGDLNLHNVLVPVLTTPHPESFRLIDLGRFARDMPISRDPMKLLLSAAGAWLPGLAPGSAARSSLAELIVRPSSYAPAPPVMGYLDVSRKIHHAGSAWGIRRSLVAEWERQNVLVLLSSALRTAARRDVATEDRLWFLEVAALASMALLRDDEGIRGRHADTPPSSPRHHLGAMPADDRGAAPSANEQEYPKSTQVPGPDPIGPGPDNLGLIKVRFCRALGGSWKELADVVLIRPDERLTFETGNEARGIWEWLEVRGRLSELRGAVIAIERGDLVKILDGS